jgi:DhnA family fructose-bisphosphate aldolase class Ia
MIVKAAMRLEQRNWLVLAVDHGLYDGNVPGLDDPEEVLLEGIARGADAVIVSPGMARRVGHTCGDSLSVPLIVSIDSDFSSVGTANPAGVIISSVDRAAALGASAVKLLMPAGGSVELGPVLTRIGRVVDRAAQLGILVVVEPVRLDEADSEEYWDALGDAARVAAEIGADVIKIEYPGEPRLRAWVETLRIPIWILGGDLRASEETCDLVRRAIAGGAQGVAMGRNIWGHGLSEMPGLLASLRQIMGSGAESDVGYP